MEAPAMADSGVKAPNAGSVYSMTGPLSRYMIDWSGLDPGRNWPTVILTQAHARELTQRGCHDKCDPRALDYVLCSKAVK